MINFSIFVDGSNLVGSLQKAQLNVDDYEKFFKYVFESGIKTWRNCVSNDNVSLPIRLHRTNWYVLGSIDKMDCKSQAFVSLMKESYLQNKNLQSQYLALTARANPTLNGLVLQNKAWENCFLDAERWYQQKAEQINKFSGFYAGINKHNDFIDVINCGHWKVDFLEKHVVEKGLDTRLAIDIAMLAPYYDVALVISGDADTIPSFTYAKGVGKQIGSVEIIKGYPPEERGRQFSSRLKAASDFVVQLYEADLISQKIATKRPASSLRIE